MESFTGRWHQRDKPNTVDSMIGIVDEKVFRVIPFNTTMYYTWKRITINDIWLVWACNSRLPPHERSLKVVLASVVLCHQLCGYSLRISCSDDNIGIGEVT